MPKELPSSRDEREQRSDALTNKGAHSQGKVHDFAVRSQTYRYTKDDYFTLRSGERVPRLRGGSEFDDYDDSGGYGGYGDSYDSGTYGSYGRDGGHGGWYGDDEGYRGSYDRGWRGDDEEYRGSYDRIGHRDDEEYRGSYDRGRYGDDGNPSDQWKEHLASTSDKSAWEREQQTKGQDEWLKDERERAREAEEWSKFREENRRDKEAFEPIKQEILELIRQWEMKDEEARQYDGSEYDSGYSEVNNDIDDSNAIAQEGPIKWVVLERSQLLTDPSLVANTVLTASEAVIAAGDYIDVVEGNERFCIEVAADSGNSHIEVTQEPEVREVADGNGGDHDGDDEPSNNINEDIDESDRDRDREKGIFAKLQEETMGWWQMLASRKQDGDEGTSQGGGVQVEHGQGDSQAQLSEVEVWHETEEGEVGAHDDGHGDGNGGDDGGSHVGYDGYSNDSDEDDKNGEDASRLLGLLPANYRDSWHTSGNFQQWSDDFGGTSGKNYADIASWDTSGNQQQWSEGCSNTGGTAYADIASWGTSGKQQQWSEFCITSGTNSSDLVVATFELKEKIRLIEEKLSADGHADQLQIIERVRQEKRIFGFDDWVAESAGRDAERMFDKVAELAAARYALQEYIDDPDVIVRVGQDAHSKGYSFDITVEHLLPNGDTEILRQIEVYTPDNGFKGGNELISAIAHAASKIPKGVRSGEIPLPHGKLEAIVAIDPWPPESSRKGKSMIKYDTHGEYTWHSVTDPTVTYGSSGNLLNDTVGLLNLSKGYTNPVEFVERLTVIDRNGRALFELTNTTPGECPAQWTWNDLQGDQ